MVGGWAAGGGLYLLIGLFGASMGPRSASQGPNKPREPIPIRDVCIGVSRRKCLEGQREAGAQPFSQVQ